MHVLPPHVLPPLRGKTINPRRARLDRPMPISDVGRAMAVPLLPDRFKRAFVAMHCYSLTVTTVHCPPFTTYSVDAGLSSAPVGLKRILPVIPSTVRERSIGT